MNNPGNRFITDHNYVQYLCGKVIVDVLDRQGVLKRNRLLAYFKNDIVQPCQIPERTVGDYAVATKPCDAQPNILKHAVIVLKINLCTGVYNTVHNC